MKWPPMPDAAVTKIMADRLQRFIPDRANAEGMANALQEDLQELNWRIIPVVGDYIADYSDTIDQQSIAQEKP